MPFITLPISSGGALVDVHIGVSRLREEVLHASGLPVPAKVPCRALIDTGASGSCIDSSIVKSLGLVPTGTATMLTPTTGAGGTDLNQYDVSISTLYPHLYTNIRFGNVAVIEADIACQGIFAIIGRDLLGNALLVYDGQSGNFTLAF
jgi:hypothetical protein